jgi:hypothetical protein
MPPSFKPFPPARRPPAVRPLADLVSGSVGPVLARHGFGESDVLLHWTEIVGADLADRCQPLRLQWPPRRVATEPATLVVRVESGSALVLQHMETVIVERLNGYLGWRCVGRLALRQGPVAPRPAPRRTPSSPEPRLVDAAARAVADFENDELRAVLTRLGARVLQRRGLREI